MGHYEWRDRLVWVPTPEKARDCCETRINEYHLDDCPVAADRRNRWKRP